MLAGRLPTILPPVGGVNIRGTGCYHLAAQLAGISQNKAARARS